MRRRFFPELPLFRRETAALLRMPRALYGLVIAVVLSATIPLLSWPEAGSAEAWAAQNRSTVLLFLFTQLGAALLAVVAFASQSIVGERTRDSLDLLRSSLFSPRGIIISKVFASAAYVLFILGATLPVACLLYLWGGVSFASLFRCEAVTLAAVLLAAFVAVDQSARARQPGTAALRALAAVLVWTLIPLTFSLPLLFAARFMVSTGFMDWYGPGRLQNTGIFFLIYCTILLTIPVFVLVLLASFVLHALGGIAGAPLGIIRGELGLGKDLPGAWTRVDWEWLVYVVLCAMASLLHLRSAARLLDMPGGSAEAALRDQTRPPPPVRTMAPTPAREPHDPMGVARRSLFTRCVLAWGRREQGPLSNPVFRREIRSEIHGSAHYWWGIFVGTTCFGVIAVAVFATGEGVGLSRGVAFLGLAIASLVVPPIAAASFPREREGGSFDLLASTPLSARTLVAGKFLSALHAAAPVAMACLLVLMGCLPITVPGIAEHGIFSLLAALRDLVLVLLVALPAVSFNIALSLFFSVRSSRTLPAMGLAYMAFLALQALPALAGSVVLPPAWALTVLPVVNPFLAIYARQALDPWGVPHEILCAALHAAGALVAIRAASASLEKRLRAP